VSQARQRILGAARRTGLEPQLRGVQRLLSSAEEKRNTRDNEHLRLLLAFRLAPDSTCIDIGANIGDILQHMVAYAPQGRHIAYEPLPELAADLAARFPAVDVRNAAVAEAVGTREFTRIRSAHTRSGLDVEGAAGDTERFPVAIEALDVSLPAGFVPSVIKIDVEGAERSVVAGAMDTIKAHRPLIAFEHGTPGGGEVGQDSRDLYALLVGGAGLRMFDFDGEGPLSEAAFLEKVRTGSHWNFLAHP
jgi:FkbM family methyltransferase